MINAQATRKTIRDELIKLRNNVKAETGDKITVIFYSGHGVENANLFYLMPAPLKVPAESKAQGVTKEAYLDDNGLSQDKLFRLIQGIPGRKLLFFDACRTGNVNIAYFVNMLRGAGILSTFTYTSAAKGKNSEECEKNGCFTQALLEAINGGAAASIFSPLNRTTTEELKRYIHKMVPKYSNFRQFPTMLSSDKELHPFYIANND